MKKAIILLTASILVLTACGKESSSKSTVAQEKATVVQTTCPILGNPIDSTLFVDQGGKRIYVCCAGCIEQVKNDFAGAEKKLADKGQKAAVVK